MLRDHRIKLSVQEVSLMLRGHRIKLSVQEVS